MARSGNGTTDYGTTQTIDLTGYATLSWFMRIKVPSFDNADHVALEFSNATFGGTPGGFVFSPNWNSTNALIGHSGDVGGYTLSLNAPRGTAGAWDTYGGVHDISLTGGSNEITYYRNGTNTAFTYDDPGNTSDSFGNQRFNFFARNGGATLFLACDMMDAAVFPGRLTDADYSSLNAGRRPIWPGLSLRPLLYWPMINGWGYEVMRGLDITWSGGSAADEPGNVDPLVLNRDWLRPRLRPALFQPGLAR